MALFFLSIRKHDLSPRLLGPFYFCPVLGSSKLHGHPFRSSTPTISLLTTSVLRDSSLLHIRIITMHSYTRQYSHQHLQAIFLSNIIPFITLDHIPERPITLNIPDYAFFDGHIHIIITFQQYYLHFADINSESPRHCSSFYHKTTSYIISTTPKLGTYGLYPLSVSSSSTTTSSTGTRLHQVMVRRCYDPLAMISG
jgi:hypothetical protein